MRKMNLYRNEHIQKRTYEENEHNIQKRTFEESEHNMFTFFKCTFLLYRKEYMKKMSIYRKEYMKKMNICRKEHLKKVNMTFCTEKNI